MNTKNRLFIDQVIIGILIRIMNLFVIILGKILKIDHRLDKNFDRIAICKFKGMGSIIQSSPLIKTLKTKYPQARLIYISTTSNKQILEEYEDIDDSILLDDRSIFSLIKTFFPFIYKLFRAKFQLYIDLEVYSNFSTLCSILSASKNRFGYYLKTKDYRRRNYTHLMYFNRNCEISQTYLQWARLLNCETISPELPTLKSTELKSDILSTFELTKNEYLVVNPNASDLRIERRWDIQRFINICEQLIKMYPNQKIVLIGSKSEKQYVEQIKKHFLDVQNIISIAGKTNISELIYILKNSKLLLTNDTGPMHLAFAVKVKTVALFGPCSPIQYGINNNCYPLYSNMYCSPCIHEFALPPCKGNNICMTTIFVDKVFSTIEEALEGKKPDQHILPKQFKAQDRISGLVNR